MQIKMNQLLRYRNVWLGVAMVWIVLYHSGFHIPSALFIYPKRWGYGGVDICLFASGIGCYFSLEKDPDILRFLKRRVLRLAPTYLCFMVFWIIYKRITTTFPWQAAVGNVLGIQALTGLDNEFNWYISALVLFYFAAPYLKQFADRISKMWQQGLLIGLLLLISVPFWGIYTYMVIVTRLPLFYIGFLFAKKYSNAHGMRKRSVFLFAFLTIFGILSLYATYKFLPADLTQYGLHWYLFILIIPGLCVLISLVAVEVDKLCLGKKIIKLIECVGKNSFEVYLVHIPIYEVLTQICGTWEFSFPANLLWLGSIPVIAVGCFLLKKIVKMVLGILSKSKTENAT